MNADPHVFVQLLHIKYGSDAVTYNSNFRIIIDFEIVIPYTTCYSEK